MAGRFIRRDSTTDLETIRKEPERFTWGIVIKIHDIGCYSIVEHHSEDGEGNERISFHPYIDGRDTAHGFGSLEEAIVSAIAFKHDGINSQAGTFFMRMIGS